MGASDFSKLPHIGEALRRKEDYRFLTGAASTPTTSRWPTRAMRCSCARRTRTPPSSRSTRPRPKMPGVVGIFTGKDIEGKMGGLPCGWLINNPDGTPMKEPPHPILAINKVRYVGDHVAMVVADTVEQARTPPRRWWSTTTCCPRW
jgi:carbon-monoxide dehydrogenase large subunit